MTCKELRIEAVGDDRAARAALERHASDCPACAEWLAGEHALDQAIHDWKRRGAAPESDLGSRIEAAIERDAPADVLPFRRISPVVRWSVGSIAAALLLFAVWIGRTPLERPEGAPTPMQSAVRAAADARKSYARAIADLELQAEPILARAGDPKLDGRSAAMILRYRDQLEHLDSVITEVQGFIEAHPGHSGGHTVLLAAYQDKQTVLDELLSLPLGDPS